MQGSLFNIDLFCRSVSETWLLQNWPWFGSGKKSSRSSRSHYSYWLLPSGDKNFRQKTKQNCVQRAQNPCFMYVPFLLYMNLALVEKNCLRMKRAIEIVCQFLEMEFLAIACTNLFPVISDQISWWHCNKSENTELGNKFPLAQTAKKKYIPWRIIYAEKTFFFFVNLCFDSRLISAIA